MASALTRLLLGILLSAAGVVAWIVLAWKAVEEIVEVEAHSVEGGRLLVWALAGTLLMIAGAVVLHFAHAGSEPEE